MLKFQAVAEKTAKDARGYFILLHLVDTDGNYVTKTEKQYLLHFTASNSQKKCNIYTICYHSLNKTLYNTSSKYQHSLCSAQQHDHHSC